MMEINTDQMETIESAMASEPVPVDSVTYLPAITKMLSRGATPEAVAGLLGIEATLVRRISITVNRSVLTDDELVDNMRNLMTIGYQRALEVFQFGPQAEQAALTRLIIGYALKSVSGETTSEFDELRGDFETMLDRMRYTPNKDFISNGAGTSTFDFDAADTDEGLNG